ncbi:hypothetical protein [Salinibacillus xinjiangensis]|uniref:Uncharacterized protein n=1 Tax=Salinibacillus xinjiangensis TaxID=1229268 RepID=A0A6G1X504_9BACI|nr:hypothetical protein [Salinibacillus xinjiangensis]MRG86044.1 hypothetical protein [Salinibacillus xinjiangensis]
MQSKHTRYWILFICFTTLFGIGTWLVELMEGSKIHTTEHIDFGLVLILYGGIGGSVVFGIFMLPLTFTMQRYFNNMLIKMMVYLTVGYFMGRLIFRLSFQDEHVQYYNLSELSSVLVFMGAGLVYALVDNYTTHKKE